MRYLEVLATLKGGGGRKKFPLFKRGSQKVLPCLEGEGARKVSDPRFSHFVAPLPISSDQSLIEHGNRKSRMKGSVVNRMQRMNGYLSSQSSGMSIRVSLRNQHLREKTHTNLLSRQTQQYLGHISSRH